MLFNVFQIDRTFGPHLSPYTLITGFVCLSIPTETFQIMRQTRAHEGSVFTLCTLQGGALLSGGGKDRKIIRWSADLAPERECEVNHNFMCVMLLVEALWNYIQIRGKAWFMWWFVQIPEKYGAVRTIADVDGEELLVGTTRNAILRGTFSDGFVAIVQVC